MAESNTMTERPFQMLLLEKIRKRLNENQSLIDYITDILEISKDSGYRRLRGETALSFDEAITLATHFQISLSEVSGQTDHSSIFIRQPFINTLDDYRQYLQRSIETLKFIKDRRNHLMMYSAKDIPIFYQFAFPKLAAFKIYVWLKSVYNIQTINDHYYSLSDIPQELLDLAYEQWSVFSQINTLEIWNDTTILSLLNQIAYYYEAGLLTDRQEALEITDQMQEMLKVIYKQAITGQKVHAHNREVQSGASCRMYYHEILIMDNHILAETGEGQLIYYVPYGGLNYMYTTDQKITSQLQSYLNGQVKKSALLSDVSEKDRNRFFIRIKSHIDQLREKINGTDPFK